MSKFNEVLARNIKGVPMTVGGFSHTVAFSHYNHLSAQLPIDPSTSKLVDGGIEEQTIQTFNNIKTIIEGINHKMDDVVRLTIFTKNLIDSEIVLVMLKSFFTTYVPTISNVIVKDIPMGASVQIEAVITCGEGTIPNAPQAGDLIKVINNTEKAPLSCSSSQSVAFSHYNNVTMQYPIDPITKKIIGGDIQQQLSQCLTNIKRILENMEVPLDDIVKVNIYTKDLALTDHIKQTYKTFFPDSAIARAVNYLPALSIIQVEDINQNALVQVDCVVSHGDGTPPQVIEDRHGIVIKHHNTPNAPLACCSSQTVAFSHYNNISSQLPIDPITKKLIEGDITLQTKTCMKHIGTILENINHKMDDIVKLNVFLQNIKDIEVVSKIIKEHFTNTIPAIRFIEVSSILKHALIQIDAVAANAEGTSPQFSNCAGGVCSR
ncbi:MAG: Rid family hydrolase [Mycoplasma sp.]